MQRLVLSLRFSQHAVLVKHKEEQEPAPGLSWVGLAGLTRAVRRDFYH